MGEFKVQSSKFQVQSSRPKHLTLNFEPGTLNYNSAPAARHADAELLTAFEAYVFAALRHRAVSSGPAADDRDDDCACAAARDAAADRADDVPLADHIH